MLTARDHNVDDYVALRDMDATDVGTLTEDDQACLDDLGRYLVSTDAWQRFAAWLLHKHFEPAAGEVFVEHVITESRQTYTTPMKRAAFTSSKLHATALRFDADASPDVDLVGMEFAEPADFGSVAPVNPADEAILAGMLDVLQSHGKTGRFGVRLIRNPLALSGDEVLSETCDLDGRTLRCTVVGRESIVSGNSVETTWQWRPKIAQDGSNRNIESKQYCAYLCNDDGWGNHFTEHV